MIFAGPIAMCAFFLSVGVHSEVMKEIIYKWHEMGA